MQDKRVVTDFRHLNVRIAKNNLAYPFGRDTFSVLGNSQCKVLLVLDLKDAFHLLRRFQKIMQYYLILEAKSYIYQGMPMDFNISPSIWQSYINAILECLQSRKYCKVIMDNLLLFTPTRKAHISLLEDLLKALLKNRLKIAPRKCQLFKTELQYMGNVIFLKNRKIALNH